MPDTSISSDTSTLGDTPRFFEGDLIAQNLRVGVVISRWNAFITDRLLEGALDTLKRHGVKLGAVQLVEQRRGREDVAPGRTAHHGHRDQALQALERIGTPRGRADTVGNG